MEHFVHAEDVTKLPSYLKCLSCKQGNILLLYKALNNKHKTKTCSETSYSLEPKNNYTVTEELELTGNPLEVDLGYDDEELLGNLSLRAQRANLWSKQEENQYPVSLNKASKLLTTYTVCQDLNTSVNYDAVYCLCDGFNDKNVVVLGTMRKPQSFLRSCVYIRKCSSREIENIDIHNMIVEHSELLQDVYGVLPSIDFEVVSTFEIYGFALEEHKQNISYPYNGSVTFEVVSNEPLFKIPLEGSQTKVKIQTIIGHEESKIHHLWQQLMVLQGCVDALAHMKEPNMSNNYEHIQFSTVHKPVEEIYQNLLTVLQTASVHKVKVSNEKKEDLASVLENSDTIFEKDLFSKLFEVLIYCENVGDLITCFYRIMEEIVQNNVTIRISPKNKTKLGEIFTRLNRDKLKTIPHLTPTDSVELFFEIGVTKLINDYSNIYSYLQYMTSAEINKWQDIIKLIQNNLNDDRMNSTPGKRCYAPLVSQPSGRNVAVSSYSRLTCIIGPATPKNEYRAKMCLLGRLHIILDMVHLVEMSCDLPNSLFTVFVDRIVADYMGPNSIISSFELLVTDRLFNYSSEFPTWNASKLREMKPSIWLLFMSSNQERQKLETVIHHSISPIFPKNIYDKYELLDEAVEEEFYYVTKMTNVTFKFSE